MHYCILFDIHVIINKHIAFFMLSHRLHGIWMRDDTMANDPYEGHTRAFRSQSLDPSLLNVGRSPSPRTRSPRFKFRRAHQPTHQTPDKRNDGSEIFEVDVNTPIHESSKHSRVTPEVFWQTAARRLLMESKHGKNGGDQADDDDVSPRKRVIRNGFMSKAGVAMRVLSDKNGRSKIHPNGSAYSSHECDNPDICTSDCKKRLFTSKELECEETTAVEKECKECCSSYEDACSRAAKIVKGIIIPSPVCRFKG